VRRSFAQLAFIADSGSLGWCTWAGRKRVVEGVRPMHVLLAQAQVSQRLQLECAPSSSRWEVGACAGETCMGQTPLLMRVWRARVHLLGLPLSATRAFLAEFRRIVAVSVTRRKSKPPDPKTFKKNESSSAKCSKIPHGWMCPGKLLYHESEVSYFVPGYYTE